MDDRIYKIGKVFVEFIDCDSGDKLEDEKSRGTLFLIRNDLAMTSLHVIKPKEILEKYNDKNLRPIISVNINGKKYDKVKLLEADKPSDICILEISGIESQEKYFEFVDYPLQVGNAYHYIDCEVLGFPYGMEAPNERDSFELPRFDAIIDNYYKDEYNLSLSFKGRIEENLYGISGSPVIVDGLIYGIITKQTVPTLGKDTNVRRSGAFQHLLSKYNIPYKEHLIPLSIQKTEEVCERYIFERKEEKIILSMINKDNIDLVQLYGLSGIGKTQLAAKLAEILSKDKNYLGIIWINAKEKDNIDFKDVEALKYNKHIDLEGMLDKNKLLIIIDDLNANVQEVARKFREINKKSSKLIITSIKKQLSDNNSVKVDFLDKDSAKILFDCCEEITDLAQDDLISYIDGHPLLINLIVNGIKSDKFKVGDILNDVKSIHNIQDSTQQKHQKFCDRIVGRYIESYKQIFSIFLNLEKTLLSKNFIKSCSDIYTIRALEDACIINNHDEFYYSIHQLIYNSIKELIPYYNSDYKFLVDKLIAYLQQQIEIRDSYYYKFVFNHIKFLQKAFEETRDSRSKNIIYNAILIYTNYKSNSENIINDLKSLELNTSEFFDLKLIIEKNEIEYALIYDEDEGKKKKQRKEKGLQIISDFKGYLVKNQFNKKNKYLIEHHIGKMYLKIGEYSEAKKYFESVINCETLMYNAKLQLARIYKNLATNRELNQSREENIKLGTEIISECLETKDNMPLTIRLGFYELIATYPYKTLENAYVKQRIDNFTHLLLTSLNENFEYAYEILKCFSGTLAIEYESKYEEILSMLPAPANIAKNTDLLLCYGQILASDYIRIKYSDKIFGEEREIKLPEKFRDAEKYLLNYVNQLSNVNRFDLKPLIDLYKKSGDYDNAEIHLKKIYNEDNPYDLKDMSEIYRNTGRAKQSLKFVEKAIEIIEKDKGKYIHYAGAFYNGYAEVLNANNNSKCVDMITKALDTKPKGKTESAWVEKKDEWVKKYNISKRL